VVRKRNWTIHSIALALVAAAWIAIAVMNPPRDGVAGLGSGLVVFIAGALALVYAAVSSLAVFFLRDRRGGAVMVHASALVGIGAAIGILFATA
jgi:hypothetical protein